MKRTTIIRSIFAAVAVAASGVWAGTWKDPDTGYTWTYRIIGDGAEICTDDVLLLSAAISPAPTNAVVIPSSLGGKPVTSIGKSAFFNCSGLTSVEIPDSVVSIGDSAFSICSGLASVKIGNHVMSIGERAFSSCRKLTSVTIPNSVTDIGERAFEDCSRLTSVTIPDGVTSIGYDAFYNCSDLLFNTSTIPGVKLVDGWVVGVTSSPAGVLNLNGARGIGSYAFFNCSGLTSVEMPDSVMSIGPSAFSCCSGLTRVTIPDGVTSIGPSAFSGCSGLTSVTIPDGVMSIGYSAFENCSGLTRVTIPNSVTNIGYWAFDNCNGIREVSVSQYVCANRMSSVFPSAYQSITNVIVSDVVTNIMFGAFSGCSGLTSVTIPNRVASIGSSAFSRCSGLTSVTIPDSVTDIGGFAFSGCSGLTSFNVTPGNACYKAESGLLLSKDGKVLVVVPGGLAGMTIPDGVTSIGDSAFYGCSRLTSVTIPDGVTSIGDYAFYDCSGLTRVTIPGSVKCIGYRVFENCSSLDIIYIPKACDIGNNALPATATVHLYKPNQTVSFDVADGSVTSSDMVVAFASPYGTLPVPKRTGYEFNGWTYQGRSIISTTEVFALDDHTLIAQWTPRRYAVTFNENGGTGGKTVTQDYGTALAAPKVTREGYTFMGWSPSVPETVPAADATYTAQWEINQYTVSFDPRGGSSVPSITQDYATSITPPASPVRTGYAFRGWSPAVPSTMPAADMTCVAQWEISQYTVSFDPRGGSSVPSITQDYATSITPPASPVRTGYTFRGWSPAVPSTMPEIGRAHV